MENSSLFSSEKSRQILSPGLAGRRAPPHFHVSHGSLQQQRFAAFAA
jgi:hypothetical protein